MNECQMHMMYIENVCKDYFGSDCHILATILAFRLNRMVQINRRVPVQV